MKEYDPNINSLLIKPLYLGLLMNMFIPVVIILIGYYLNNQSLESKATDGTLSLIFWIFVGVSAMDGGVAFYFKQKLFFQPMIYSRETFDDDLKNGIFTNSIVCFALTTSISIYGLVYFLIENDFKQMIFFVFISIIAFQLVRPRPGFLKKIVAHQEELMTQGRFKERLK
ncbi:MAG: hypothetical protein ABIJ45_06890 [Candidatus Zixiibacteriota bacterium]